MNRGAAFIALHCLVFASTAAQARQGANSTPLTLAAGNIDIHTEHISIVLDGSTVRLTVNVTNDEATTKRLGFYAFTPFFWNLGTGDPYQDKRFSEVEATLNGRTLAPVLRQRGVHLGQDITAVLTKNGLAPLPDNNSSTGRIRKLPMLANMRPVEWQGMVTYSWTFDAVRGSRDMFSVRYRALPEFFLSSAEGGLFARKIRQHCGDVAQVMAFLANADARTDSYVVQRYDIPFIFMQNDAVSLTVKQAEVNQDGTRPMLSLACTDSPSATLSSTIVDEVRDAGNALSILVISLPERTAQ